MCANIHGQSVVTGGDLPAMAATCPNHVPIGSVEWTREWARKIGVNLSDRSIYLSTYPQKLRPHLHRDVYLARFCAALPDSFVKPARCKAFTGGIKAALTEAVKPNESCWISEPVTWGAEWRCYVLHGQIVGVGQYDDGEDDVEIDITAAQAIADSWVGPAGYSLDLGMLGDQLALVEVNDGWALGYYSGCPRDAYLDVISARWAEILEAGK